MLFFLIRRLELQVFSERATEPWLFQNGKEFQMIMKRKMKIGNAVSAAVLSGLIFVVSPMAAAEEMSNAEKIKFIDKIIETKIKEAGGDDGYIAPVERQYSSGGFVKRVKSYPRLPSLAA